MTDTQILAIFMRKKSENVDTSILARALSEGQCGILTMIDISSFAILYEKKIFENVLKRLGIARALSVGQCGILMMIDTPISAIFMRNNKHEVPISVYQKS